MEERLEELESENAMLSTRSCHYRLAYNRSQKALLECKQAVAQLQRQANVAARERWDREEIMLSHAAERRQLEEEVAQRDAQLEQAHLIINELKRCLESMEDTDKLKALNHRIMLRLKNQERELMFTQLSVRFHLEVMELLACEPLTRPLIQQAIQTVRDHGPFSAPELQCIIKP